MTLNKYSVIDQDDYKASCGPEDWTEILAYSADEAAELFCERRDSEEWDTPYLDKGVSEILVKKPDGEVYLIKVVAQVKHTYCGMDITPW
jgi:hypothetical protein